MKQFRALPVATQPVVTREDHFGDTGNGIWDIDPQRNPIQELLLYCDHVMSKVGTQKACNYAINCEKRSLDPQQSVQD